MSNQLRNSNSYARVVRGGGRGRRGNVTASGAGRGKVLKKGPEGSQHFLTIYLSKVRPEASLKVTDDELSYLCLDSLKIPKDWITGVSQSLSDLSKVTIRGKFDLTDFGVEDVEVRPGQLLGSAMEHRESAAWVYFYGADITMKDRDMMKAIEDFGSFTTEMQEYLGPNQKGRLAGIWTGDRRIGMMIQRPIPQFIFVEGEDYMEHMVKVVYADQKHLCNWCGRLRSCRARGNPKACREGGGKKMVREENWRKHRLAALYQEPIPDPDEEEERQVEGVATGEGDGEGNGGPPNLRHPAIENRTSQPIEQEIMEEGSDEEVEKESSTNPGGDQEEGETDTAAQVETAHHVSSATAESVHGPPGTVEDPEPEVLEPEAPEPFEDSMDSSEESQSETKRREKPQERRDRQLDAQIKMKAQDSDMVEIWNIPEEITEEELAAWVRNLVGEESKPKVIKNPNERKQRCWIIKNLTESQRYGLYKTQRRIGPNKQKVRATAYHTATAQEDFPKDGTIVGGGSTLNTTDLQINGITPNQSRIEGEETAGMETSPPPVMHRQSTGLNDQSLQKMDDSDSDEMSEGEGAEERRRERKRKREQASSASSTLEGEGEGTGGDRTSETSVSGGLSAAPVPEELDIGGEGVGLPDNEDNSADSENLDYIEGDGLNEIRSVENELGENGLLSRRKSESFDFDMENDRY